jgi:methionine-rich copper-binding protein CopC
MGPRELPSRQLVGTPTLRHGLRHGNAIGSALVAGLLMAAWASTVGAHVELISSSPVAGANLSTIPTEVTITFDDELDPDSSHFEVTDSASVQVGSGEVDLTVADRNVMTGPVTITAPGVCTVSYAVAGIGGHVLNGTFSFGYQATSAIPGSTGGEGADTAMAPRGGPSVLLLLGWILLISSGVIAARRIRAR